MTMTFATTRATRTTTARGMARRSARRGRAVLPSRATAVNGADVDAMRDALEGANATPLEIMDKALETYGDGLAIAFSGAEDVAVIQYAALTGRPYRVFSLDAGRSEEHRLNSSHTVISYAVFCLKKKKHTNKKKTYMKHTCQQQSYGCQFR